MLINHQRSSFRCILIRRIRAASALLDYGIPAVPEKNPAVFEKGAGSIPQFKKKSRCTGNSNQVLDKKKTIFSIKVKCCLLIYMICICVYVNYALN